MVSPFSRRPLQEFAFFQEGPGLRRWQWTTDGMKVINVTNILGDGCGTVDTTNTDKYISLLEFEERYKHFAVELNDIVVASSGNTYGKAGRITKENLPVMMNTSVIRFHSRDSTKLDDEYLYAFLRSPGFREQVNQFVTGGAQPNFGPSHLNKMTIPVPDIHTQRRIGNHLSNYDRLMQNNRRRIQLLEQAARLLYKEWFVRLRFPGHERVKVKDGVPEGWERKRLSELCTDIRESIDPKTLPPETAYIGLEHIPRRSITLSDWGTAAKIGSSKFKFTEGDILFGKIRPYFHKVGFTLVGGITSSDAIVIRATNSLFYHYVLFLLSSDEFVALASKTVREGSKMPRADWKFLLKSEFNRPAKAVLELFNNSMKPICAQLKSLALHNQQLTIARDLLLPRLMSGKVAI